MKSHFVSFQWTIFSLLSDNRSPVALENERKRVDANSASFVLFRFCKELPDLWEGCVDVEILEPRFVTALHICKLGKEQLLLGVG
jgi:hypothetical protein